MINDGDVQILHGDALETLRTLPDCSVQMIASSPPFWGLRDYQVDGQIGLEESPACNGAAGLMRVRSDLTPDQRAYVARRIAEEAIRDA